VEVFKGIFQCDIIAITGQILLQRISSCSNDIRKFATNRLMIMENTATLPIPRKFQFLIKGRNS
jgi:hypothetical protein